MENFMNKLFVSPNLLEDEKLNYKIEKIFENKVFQKMVENANVLEDAGAGSRDDGERSDEQVDMKHILDSKLIEQSELLVPYHAPEESEAAANPQKGKKQKEEEKMRKLKELTSKKKKEGGKVEESSLMEVDNRRSEEDTGRLENQIRKEDQNISGIDGGTEKSVEGNSEFLEQSESIVELMAEEDEPVKDDYENDDDPGFDLYEVGEDEFDKICKHLAREFNFPERACKEGRKRRRQRDNRLTDEQIAVLAEKKNGYIFLPETLKHPVNNDTFYPVCHDKTVYDCFNLKVIYDRERTGFEETKEFPIVIGSIIAGRYQTMEYLGSAAFSKAIQCLDLKTNQHYCMKIIENNKDYFDQSIDEIKLLKFINTNGDVDQKNVLRIHDYFYHKVWACLAGTSVHCH